MNRDELIEDVARAIAAELGYEWDSLYENKSEWINDRGSRHDINTPFRPYFRDAARAVVAVTLEAAAKVAEAWLQEYCDVEMRLTSPKDHAVAAVADVRDAIRSLLPSPPR